MKPFIENLIISLMTGLLSGANAMQSVLTSQPITTQDMMSVGIGFTVAFAGTMINGMRQLNKTPGTTGDGK